MEVESWEIKRLREDARRIEGAATVALAVAAALVVIGLASLGGGAALADLLAWVKAL
jgi:hypothetical protein